MPFGQHRRAVLISVSLALAAGSLTGIAVAGSGAGAHVTGIETLSVRADLVSGGEVLTQIDLAPGSATSDIHVALNGADVSKSFAWRAATHKYEGLLQGLKLGSNTVVATGSGGHGAELTVTNHPLGGPVFSGPQIMPWTCQAGAKDKQCNQTPKFTYTYIRAGDGSAQSYDPANPPSSAEVQNTTTLDGVTVPFIYRTETGYIDRDQYAISVLFQPGKPWQPFAPQKQFLGRMVITHGASCDESYTPAGAPSTTDKGIVGDGFIVISNALDNAGHNCNIITQAESLVMTKQYAIDHYGAVKWTIGSGCSGGSLVQQQVANAYPGLYQGITPQCSFTDAWSSGMEYTDYTILLRYFEDPSRWDPGTVWDPAAISQVLDHPNIGNPITFTTAIPNNADPTHSCTGLDSSKQYNAQSNPHGVRCTLEDYEVNIFGKNKDGKAKIAYGNEGIQYGLQGLHNGLISPAQFVDLNTNLGGTTADDLYQPARSKADLLATKRVYQSGAADEANNLNQVAIIDLRGPDEGSFHDVYRTYALRERLLRNFGTAANQVLWRGQVALLGDVNYVDQSVVAEDRWLARVYADHRNVPLPQKIIQDKPGDLTDRCTNGAGTEIPSWECDAVVASYGTPRMSAGMPLADDILVCQLKPLRKSDYSVTFTDDQWARLKKAFPTGVCDYSKLGQQQQGAVAWLTYQDSSGHVIYGGKPLGAPPVSSPV
jgi:hypothetical protein